MNLRDLLSNFFILDPRKVDWKRTAILVLCVLLVLSLLWHKFMPEVRTIDTTTFKRVPEIHQVQTVQRVYVPCPQQGIQVLDKQAVTAKLGLGWQQGALADKPDTILSTSSIMAAPSTPSGVITLDPGDGLYITATAEIPESANGYEAINLIDFKTGKSTIAAKENEAPWFQFRNDGALGVRYGINEHLQPIGTVYGRWDFLRIRGLYFSANGTMATDGDAALQLGAEYRW